MKISDYYKSPSVRYVNTRSSNFRLSLIAYIWFLMFVIGVIVGGFIWFIEFDDFNEFDSVLVIPFVIISSALSFCAFKRKKFGQYISIAGVLFYTFRLFILCFDIFEDVEADLLLDSAQICGLPFYATIILLLIFSSVFFRRAD